MRMLKYAILGLVGREPMTGYDIKKAFEGNLSRFWSAKHSQIYPELNELLQEGMVSYNVTIQGVKMEKKYYSITPTGRQELINWLKTTCEIEPVQKEAFRLKLYFGDYCKQKDCFTEVFQDQYRQHKQRLDTLQERIQEISNPFPERRTPDFSEYLLARGGLLREQAYLDWMQECAELLNVTVEP